MRAFLILVFIINIQLTAQTSYYKKSIRFGKCSITVFQQRYDQKNNRAPKVKLILNDEVLINRLVSPLGDYHGVFGPYYSKNKNSAGYSGTNGQPSLIWKTSFFLADENIDGTEPEIIGHGHILGKDHHVYADVSYIKSARETFQYIGINYIAEQ